MSDVRKGTLGSISTPDLVETNIGSFEFTDVAPSKAAVERAYDHLEFVHRVNVFLNSFGGGVDVPAPISATDRAPNVFVLDAAGCGQPTKTRWTGSWPSSDAEVEVLRACLR